MSLLWAASQTLIFDPHQTLLENLRLVGRESLFSLSARVYAYMSSEACAMIMLVHSTWHISFSIELFTHSQVVEMNTGFFSEYMS